MNWTLQDCLSDRKISESYFRDRLEKETGYLNVAVTWNDRKYSLHTKLPFMSDCTSKINSKEQNANSTEEVARRSRNFPRYMHFSVDYCLHSALSALMSRRYLLPSYTISRPRFVQLCFKDDWLGLLMCYEVRSSIIVHCVRRVSSVVCSLCFAWWTRIVLLCCTNTPLKCV